MESTAGGDSPLALALDIGGSKINAALVGKDGAIAARRTYAGPIADYELAISEISHMVGLLAEHEPAVRIIGVSLAGMLSADRKSLRQSIFPDWRGRPVASDLELACSLPVTLENDGNAAAWGEFRYGAGKGASTFALLTLGTGIGGGIVMDGRLHRGAHGIAAELGHIQVTDGGTQCGCGGTDCLEAYASGRRLVREYAAYTEFHATAIADSALTFRPLGLDQRREIEAAFARDLTQGRKQAVDLLADIGRCVGRAIDILVRVLDPETIAIGGGVSMLGQPLLTAIEDGAEAARTHVRIPCQTRLVLAELRNDAGLVGAASLARTVSAATAPPSTGAARLPIPANDCEVDR